MTDPNNFQFKNDGSKEAVEAVKILGHRIHRIHTNWYYGKQDGSLICRNWIAVDCPLITPAEALALLKPVEPASISIEELIEQLEKLRDYVIPQLTDEQANARIGTIDECCASIRSHIGKQIITNSKNK